MKTAAVTRIGSLRDPDPRTRGRIEVVEFPEQEVGSEDVKVRIAYAGICGSDPHLAEGFFRKEVPIGLGHEISGIVEELGPRATRSGLRVGDRVAGNFLRYCGTCIPCREGMQQFCPNTKEYSRPGMAEYLVWHESQLYRLPDEVPLAAGALLEPTSIAVRIADKTRIRVGDRVAVCGGGAIGQLVVQVMRMYGATALTIIEPIAERRQIALRHGAEHAIDPTTEDQRSRADAITAGRGYDIVIDASGSTRATRGLLDLAARGGTVVYGAMYPSDYELPLNLSEHLYLRELTLTGAFVAPYSFPRALQVLPRLSLDELTRAVYPLERAAEAFDVHLSGVHPKVLIQPNPHPESK